MGIKTKVKIGDKFVDGEELEFKPKKEEWNIYEAEDGSIIKVKVVVSKIIRTNEKHPLRNDPIYSVSSQTIVDARVPEKLKMED